MRRGQIQMEQHGTPRKPCANCARKHLGQAIVLLQESIHGYPEHRWIAVGHIAEAEAEIEGIWQDMADEFRKIRKKMEVDDGWMPDLVPVIRETSKRMREGKKATCDVCVMAEEVEGASLPSSKLPSSSRRYRIPVEDLDKKYTRPQLDTKETMFDVARGRRGSRTSVAREIRGGRR